MSDDLAVRARKLGKMYRIGAAEAHSTLRDAVVDTVRKPWMRVRHPGAATSSMETLWALRDVDLDVRRGEVLGVIGRNGAGKSTLLKVLSRITEPTTGQVELEGRVGSLLEVGTGFHPELTGRENIYLNGAILGMPRVDIDRKFDDIVEFSEVSRFLDTPVKRYSSGMYVRLAFAVAAHLEPEILVIDEVLSVGDAAFQKKCLGRMEDVAHDGRTVLFVSHNMQAVRTLCTRVVELEQGRVVYEGPAGEGVDHYLRDQVNAESEYVWPAGERPGDDDVRLVSMHVLDEEGLPVTTHMNDRPFTVRLVLDLKRVHPDLTVGFDLMSGDGMMVMRGYQTDGPSDTWPRLRPGMATVECQVPAGVLNDGRYIVLPRVSIHKVRWIVHGERGVAFDVERQTYDSPYALTQRPGVVAPAMRWRAIPGAPRGAPARVGTVATAEAGAAAAALPLKPAESDAPEPAADFAPAPAASGAPAPAASVSRPARAERPNVAGAPRAERPSAPAMAASWSGAGAAGRGAGAPADRPSARTGDPASASRGGVPGTDARTMSAPAWPPPRPDAGNLGPETPPVAGPATSAGEAPALGAPANPPERPSDSTAEAPSGGALWAPESEEPVPGDGLELGELWEAHG